MGAWNLQPQKNRGGLLHGEAVCTYMYMYTMYNTYIHVYTWTIGSSGMEVGVYTEMGAYSIGVLCYRHAASDPIFSL